MVGAEGSLAQQVAGAEHGHQAGSIGGSTDSRHLERKNTVNVRTPNWFCTRTLRLRLDAKHSEF